MARSRSCRIDSRFRMADGLGSVRILSTRVRSGACLRRLLDPLPRASFYAIQAAADGALVVLRHKGALGLIATIEERRLEGVFQILEQAVVFRPGDHRSRRHESRHVASLEASASLFGRPHHLQNELAAFLGRQPGRLGKDDPPSSSSSR